MTLDRAEAALVATATVAILNDGRYMTPGGQQVDIAGAIAAAVAGTVAYPPEAPLPAVAPGHQTTEFTVQNETTLVAAQRLAEAGQRPVALNFASAKRPGGGFLNGALAQEESLARSSGLYACLAGNAMYAYHRQRKDSMYSDYAIYSPAVPVFRRDDGTLLEAPYACAFISAPAPNATALRRHGGRRLRRAIPALAARIAKVLTIGAAHGHDTIILGAWGCGVFGNDPRTVAALFSAALTGPFAGVYARVAFAVLDNSPDRQFIEPFERAFAL